MIFFEASDNLSGIKSVKIYYGFDGGIAQEFGVFSASPILFNASMDGRYDFYSIAQDNVDNLENYTSPDASIIVDTNAPILNDIMK